MVYASHGRASCSSIFHRAENIRLSDGGVSVRRGRIHTRHSKTIGGGAGGRVGKV